MNHTFGANRVEAEKRFSWHFCAARLNPYRFSQYRTQYDIAAKRSWNAKIGNTSFTCLPTKNLRTCLMVLNAFATLVCIEANVECENTWSRNPRSRNPISTIIVSGCTAYQKRSGIHDARLSFKIFHHLSLSLYLWTYVLFILQRNPIAMLIHARLRRALCPLLVIRFTVLLFLRPLLLHTLFLVYMLR